MDGRYGTADYKSARTNKAAEPSGKAARTNKEAEPSGKAAGTNKAAEPNGKSAGTDIFQFSIFQIFL